MSYTSYADVNQLEEVGFIAGTSYFLDFKIYDVNGLPIENTGIAMTWKLAPYGEKSYVATTKIEGDGDGPHFQT